MFGFIISWFISPDRYYLPAFGPNSRYSRTVDRDRYRGLLIVGC